MRRALAGVVILSIGTLLGCKGSGGGGNDGGGGNGGGGDGGNDGGDSADGGAIPIDATATQIAAAICPKAYQCCTGVQLQLNSRAGMTEVECEASTAELFRGLLQTVQTSQDAQRSRFEPSKVDACLTTIRDSTCAMLNVTNHLSGVPNCASLTTPLVAAGDTCSEAFECIDGVCQKASGANEGTCGPGVAAGQSCAVNMCAPSLICDPRDLANASDDVCAPPQDDGTTCTNAVQCRSGTCAAPASGGATVCMAGNQCFYGNACAAAGGRPTWVTLLAMGALLTMAALRSRRSRGRRGARVRMRARR